MAPSRGARRAPAVPAPGPRARRCGPAAAPSSGPIRATTPSRSTARRAVPRCGRRCRLHAERESLAVFDADRVRCAVDQAGRGAAGRLAVDRPDGLDAGPPLRGRGQRRPARSAICASVDVMPVADAGVADVIGAATLLVSETALEELVARANSNAARLRLRRRGGCVMDASQVIIRPVVSEKSFVLAEAGKYTFRVNDRRTRRRSARPSSSCGTSRWWRSAPPR